MMIGFMLLFSSNARSTSGRFCSRDKTQATSPVSPLHCRPLPYRKMPSSKTRGLRRAATVKERPQFRRLVLRSVTLAARTGLFNSLRAEGVVLAYRVIHWLMPVPENGKKITRRIRQRKADIVSPTPRLALFEGESI